MRYVLSALGYASVAALAYLALDLVAQPCGVHRQDLKYILAGIVGVAVAMLGVAVGAR